MAAVLYVLRTLVADEIPLNSGCLKPVQVIIPPGSLLAPGYPAAVAAGNVETRRPSPARCTPRSACMAEGSGTMNNVTFGNARHQYYETVASGSGAGDGFDGTDAVQTHMTNSRLTDPEVLEWRYPVRLERYEIRRGSGGAGRWPGGDGGRRRLRFREPMTVTTLASHRRVPPYGMAGGQPGALGRHWVERPDGRVPMRGCDTVPVGAGRRLRHRDPRRRRLRHAGLARRIAAASGVSRPAPRAHSHTHILPSAAADGHTNTGTEGPSRQGANEAPSSEVKHAALLNDPPSASTVTARWARSAAARWWRCTGPPGLPVPAAAACIALSLTDRGCSPLATVGARQRGAPANISCGPPPSLPGTPLVLILMTWFGTGCLRVSRGKRLPKGAAGHHGWPG